METFNRGRWQAPKLLGLVLGVAVVSNAQLPATLSLADAEKLALQNHPRIASANLTAQAAEASVTQVRSAFYPTLSGNLTSAGADQGTAISAGALPTSSLSSRSAAGLAMSQLVTDFGRTGNLAEAAKFRAAAQRRNIATSRADILLQVDQSYYATLGAEAVLRVAQATVEARRITLRQVKALALSSLKSTFDVSFAEVAVSEAELALYQAENNARSNHSLLSAALGYERDEQFALSDVSLPAPLDSDPEALVREALNNRPDLAVLKLNQTAAARFAEAEKRLRYPAISLVGVVGAVPLRQDNFSSRYGAAGVNITVPFLNGGLFAARMAEADLRAQAASKDADALAVRVAADTRVAWFEANNAFHRLDITARLVDQAGQALRLANARYEIGLGTIIEVTQAQLSQTSAQIAAANAKYDYLARIARVNYAIGAFQ
jgi:outer membrane protein